MFHVLVPVLFNLLDFEVTQQLALVPAWRVLLMVITFVPAVLVCTTSLGGLNTWVTCASGLCRKCESTAFACWIQNGEEMTVEVGLEQP